MKNVIWVFAMLSLLGCTTLKSVEQTEGFAFTEVIQVGEVYQFTTSDGSVTMMKVLEVTDDEVTGSLSDEKGKKFGGGRTLQTADIVEIEILGIDGAKTTLAVIGGIILIPIALVAIVIGCMMGCGM